MYEGGKAVTLTLRLEDRRFVFASTNAVNSLSGYHRYHDIVFSLCSLFSSVLIETLGYIFSTISFRRCIPESAWVAGLGCWAANLCNAERDETCLEASATHIQYGHGHVYIKAIFTDYIFPVSIFDSPGTAAIYPCQALLFHNYFTPI